MKNVAIGLALWLVLMGVAGFTPVQSLKMIPSVVSSVVESF
jgi:hypothetical protein